MWVKAIGFLLEVSGPLARFFLKWILGKETGPEKASRLKGERDTAVLKLTAKEIMEKANEKVLDRAKANERESHDGKKKKLDLENW